LAASEGALDRVRAAVRPQVDESYCVDFETTDPFVGNLKEEEDDDEEDDENGWRRRNQRIREINP
jgi:hypothetical protein